MTQHMPSNRPGIAALTLLMLSLAAPVVGQEQKGFAKVGGYAGGSFAPNFTFDGKTFDGETFYQELIKENPDVWGPEILILPKIDEQHKFKGILGYRGRATAVEFSYERTNHGGTFFEGSGEATFQSVNVDGRFFFLTNQRFQPYVLAGGGIPWFTVKEGSFLEDDLDGGADDGSWKGLALNTEVGVTIYPTPRVGIAVGYGYRAIWFDRATGITDKLYDLRPRFREASKGLVVTGLYTF